MIAMACTCKGIKKRRHRKKARGCAKQLRTWVEQGNPNILHLFELLNAEITSLDCKMNNCLNIQKGYDKAIMLSARLGALHLQALGNESAEREYASLN
jgi:hypothetical protein